MPIPDLDGLHRPVLEILQAADRPLTRQETLEQLLCRKDGQRSSWLLHFPLNES